MAIEDELHDLVIIATTSGLNVLECSCGWRMNRPGAYPSNYSPWPVRDIVDVSNSHLTAVTS